MTASGDRRLFCFGLGYTATRLAARLAAAGWRVAGTRRDGAAGPREDLPGVTLFPYDGGGPPADAVKWLEGTTHLLISVPPGTGGDPVIRDFGPALGAAGGIAWAGYLSTTGVYGNTDGRMVDETAPVQPNVKRSQSRVEAERAWQGLAESHGLPLHIFRLAGIYGPGRNVLRQARAGKARRIDKPGHQFSRTHVDDIVQVLEASIAQPNTGAIYNVCDDEPAEPAAVTTFACELLGIEPPDPLSFEEAAKAMSPMGLTFWQDNRRVDNSKVKKELGVEWLYPTYREGLRALLETEAGD